MRMLLFRLALFVILFTAPSLLAQGRFVKSFDNATALVQANPFDVNTNAFLAGYVVPNDGGQGLFTYNRASVAATNIWRVFMPTNGVGRWLRVNSDVTLQSTAQAGAYQILVTDMYVISTATSTKTLPDASDVGSGKAIKIFSLAGVLTTVAAAAGDTIVGGSVVAASSGSEYVSDGVSVWQQQYPAGGAGNDSFATVADMLAANPAAVNTNAFVQGYFTPGDWGEPRIFIYTAGSSLTTNFGTVFKPTSFTGRWQANTNGPFNVRYFGAKGDGVTDDGLRIQNALYVAAAQGGGTVLVPKGTYAFTTNFSNGGLIVSNNVTLAGQGWDSELLFTYDNNLGAAGGVGISSSSALGLTQAAQDLGNTNITLVNFKLRFVTSVPAKGIGLAMGGVNGLRIENVWVDNVGGYSIYVAKNNPTAAIDGKMSANTFVRGCRITRMVDTGLELRGVTNCFASDLQISGAGDTATVSYALFIWDGAQNCQIRNVFVEGIGASNNLSAVGFAPTESTNVLFRQTSNNIVSGVLAKNILKAARIGFGPDGGRKVYRSIIEGSQFFGQATNAAQTVPIQIFNATDVQLRNVDVYNYRGDVIRISDPNDTGDQLSVTNVIISGCVFRNVGPAVIHGLQELQFTDNWLDNIPDNAGLKFYGVREAIVSLNRFSDIGEIASGAGVQIYKGMGSITRESQYIALTGNKSWDTRATKQTLWTIILNDATDYVTAVGNSNAGGKSGEIDIANASTGTHNSLLSSEVVPAGFHILGGSLALDNEKSITFLATNSANTARIKLDGADALTIVGAMTNSDIFFGPFLGSNSVAFKSDGKVGIKTLNPNYRLTVESEGNDFPLGVQIGGPPFTPFYVQIGAQTNGSMFLQSNGVEKVAIAAVGTSYFIGGNVGIGLNNPLSLFGVGAGDKFRVDNNGNLIRINDVALSWPVANAVGGLQNDGAGNLTWTAGAGSGTVTHTAGALTLDLPVFGNGASDLKVGTKTGTGIQAVMDTSPTIVTPVIGQISSSVRVTGVITNDALTADRLVVAGANKELSSTISSANAASSVTDETGSGLMVFGTGPTLTDAIAASSFQLPNGAAPTTDAFGEIAGDNNAWAAGRGTVQLFDGTANAYVVAALASDVPSNGQVPQWNTGGTVTWETVSGVGQTNPPISSLTSAENDNTIDVAFFQRWNIGPSNDGIILFEDPMSTSSGTSLLKLEQQNNGNGNALWVRRDGTNIFQINSNSIVVGTDFRFVDGAHTAGSIAVFDANTNLISGTQTGTGSYVASQSPTLVTPTIGVAAATTINKVTLTAPATGSTLTIADGKTLTVSQDVTLNRQASTGLPVEFCIAISDETTALTTGAAKVTFRAPYAFTITAVRASVNTVSSSGLPTFDVNDSGASIFSTTLTIDVSEKTSVTATTPAVISDSAIADDAELTIDIDTAGTGTKGAKIWILGYR